MRRMVKEDLLTFDGKPLFPERIAETVPYELTELEQDLYDQVTTYVREGMNRAAKLDGKRRNTVGFALTVLQRRLASSPEAIYRSLERRAERLERRKQEVLAGSSAEPKAADAMGDLDEFDDDEFSAEEMEEFEEELVDAATAARTVEELDAELLELADLIKAAPRVRASDTDRKWSELRTILEDNTLATTGAGDERRKLIVFTEHRDTLDYLSRRIGSLLGRPEAVEGDPRRRPPRRAAADHRGVHPQPGLSRSCSPPTRPGEGLNLQVAHLMVNYDLPWNPNRIEQRFGRIHRIGQREVCRLWNLVADNTREGDVFKRLLWKIEEQRKAYGGKVFDVLGTAFSETPLRTLLIDAIRYGELPETKANMEKVIDASVARRHRGAARRARALASDDLAAGRPRAAARADGRGARPPPAAALHRGRLQSSVHAAWRQIRRREHGRFEITHVPAQLRTSRRGPIATRYDRVTFDLAHVLDGDRVRAELLAPGHPLHDAVTDQTVDQWRRTLDGHRARLPTVRGAAPARRRHRGDRRRHRAPRSRGVSATRSSTSTAPSRPPARRRILTVSRPR